MAIDETTLASGTPQTVDGRKYPDHLRPYEQYDLAMLEVAESLARPFTFDALAVGAPPNLRYDVPRWLASAEWRALLERAESSMRSPRVYHVTDRGLERLERLRREAA